MVVQYHRSAQFEPRRPTCTGRRRSPTIHVTFPSHGRALHAFRGPCRLYIRDLRDLGHVVNLGQGKELSWGFNHARPCGPQRSRIRAR